MWSHDTIYHIQRITLSTYNFQYTYKKKTKPILDINILQFIFYLHILT